MTLPDNTAIRYNSSNGNQYGILVKTTKAKMYVILTEKRMHIRRIPISEERYVSELESPIKKVKLQLRQYAKRQRMVLAKDTKEALR